MIKPSILPLSIMLWSGFVYGSEYEQTLISLELKKQEAKPQVNAVEERRLKQAAEEPFEPEERHWLSDLLREGMVYIQNHPQILSHEHSLKQIDLNIEKAKSAWSPQVTANQSYNESERVSFSVVEGGGVITNTNERSQLNMSKNFDTGSSVSLGVNQNKTDSSSADRTAREQVNSAMTLSITQNLLKGRLRSANRFEINEYEVNKYNEENRRKAALETQLLDYGSLCLDIAEVRARIKTRQAHLDIAVQERETEKARVEEGLSPQRQLLSHQRNVLDLELQLVAAQRRLKTLEKDLALNWPGMGMLSEKILKEMVETDFASVLRHAPEYDLTRTGQDWQSKLNLDQRRVAVMRHRKLDALDLQFSYNRRGIAQETSESWEMLKSGDSNEWNVGLNYKHVFGRDRDRLNYTTSKIRSEQTMESYRIAKLNWQKKRGQLEEEYHNASDNMKERLLLLEIQEKERALLAEELKEGLVRLEEVFNTDKALLNARLNLISQRKQQRLIDLKLREHDDIILELIP